MIKVLHILFRLSPGGVETWLMQVLNHIDRQRFGIDLAVHSTDKGLFEDQAKALGGVLRLPNSSNPRYYGREFRRLLVEHGPYQVIHCHLALGGFHLRWAHQAGIPIRIAHAHVNEDRRTSTASFNRALMLRFSHYLMKRHATLGLAVSGAAARGWFGLNWQKDSRFQILPAAISLDAFTGKLDRGRVRRALGLPKSTFVLGHVGRFVPEKNHSFLIEIAAEVCHRLPEARLLLVGDGPLRRQVEDQVRTLGLDQRVLFTGPRHDVPEILQGVVDLFIFPSRQEAAPLAVVEAQAAGLPCLIADTIPQEIVVIPELVQRVPLSTGPRGWAEVVLAARKNRAALSPPEAAGRIRQTSFDIEANVRRLERFYSAGPIAPAPGPR